MTGHEPPPKPKLRGVQHQWAAVFAFGAATGLIALAPTARASLAMAIYAASLALLFTVSAVYHRFHWTPATRVWLQRADHAAIFLLIAGTYTPIAMLAMPAGSGQTLLWAIWIGAALGIGVSMWWPQAPKWVSASIAVAVGWMLVPYIDVIAAVLSRAELWLIALGGIAYTVGAVIYAIKRPNPWPRHFGYHEIFHALTLVGAGMHLAALLSIVRGVQG